MEDQIKAFCLADGVPFKIQGERFRVMDVTQLPMAMRQACDERGFVIVAAEQPEAVEDTGETAINAESVVSTRKRRK